jgi:hypothetical protein
MILPAVGGSTGRFSGQFLGHQRHARLSALGQHRRQRMGAHARRTAGLSKSGMARVVGVFPSTVYQWEQLKGGRNPGSNHVKAIKTVLPGIASWWPKGEQSPTVIETPREQTEAPEVVEVPASEEAIH